MEIEQCKELSYIEDGYQINNKFYYYNHHYNCNQLLETIKKKIPLFNDSKQFYVEIGRCKIHIQKREDTFVLFGDGSILIRVLCDDYYLISLFDDVFICDQENALFIVLNKYNDYSDYMKNNIFPISFNNYLKDIK